MEHAIAAAAGGLIGEIYFGAGGARAGAARLTAGGRDGRDHR